MAKVTFQKGLGIVLAIATALSLMGPTSNAQAGDNMRGVSFMTLRDRGDGNDPSDYFGDGRGQLTAGWCGVDRTDLSFLAPAADIAPFRIPDEILDVKTVEERPIAEVMSALKGASGNELTMYIHGYYIDFEKGCRRATIFKENAGLNDRFLWFSWPSAGSLLNYPRDELNVFWSAPDLAKVISELRAEFGDGNVDLAAHSLGARGLMLALYEVAASQPDVRFGDVAMLAPDIDFDVFRKFLPRISQVVRSLTIYTSKYDAALVTSAQLHGYPRLGQSDNDVGRLIGVEVVDTSDLSFTSANGHLYHIYNQEVGADLNALMTQGKSANERANLERVSGNLWKLLPTE